MKTIAIANQKGGTGKTTTAVNMGVALHEQGYKVLLVDFDPQGNLTSYLGADPPDSISKTITTLMQKEIKGEVIFPGECIRHAEDGVDYIPSNIKLSSMNEALYMTMCREVVLRGCLENFKDKYDYCLIDCAPSLGLLLVNALAVADQIIIPVQAQPFSLQGMADLTETIADVKRKINPQIEIGGIVLTMTEHTNLSKEVCDGARAAYGSNIHVFDTEIPKNVRTAESSGYNHSVLVYEPKCASAMAYRALTKEVLELGRQQVQNRADYAHSR